MIDLVTLSPGDQVRVVSSWVPDKSGSENWNLHGEMDKWLGTIMTVDRVYVGYVRMKEDEGWWAWYEEMLEPTEPEPELEAGDLDGLYAMMEGKTI